MKDSTTHKKKLSYVIEDIKEWPIYKISQDKEKYLQEIITKTKQETLERLQNEKDLFNEIKKIRYQEIIRLKKNPWQSDKPSELEFWKMKKKEIISISSIENESERKEELGKQLNEIMDLYANEIVANFDPSKHNIARKIIPIVFARLLNAFPGKLYKLFTPSKSLYEKLQLNGEIEQIRKLSTQGTLVFVPTHFSNLDSPTIGIAIDGIGLPAVTYGAGINLFTIKLLSNFMNNLGSYKVDRRRRNEVYLNLLKNYSTLGLTRGVHSLFFPGGTRSRSGAIEDKLKLGLLGTAVESQQINLSRNTKEKIFIVPVVLNYHFVMEASKLINEHLKAEGKENYLNEDEFKNSFKIIKFIYKFFTATPKMIISFGKPIDVLGNKVNENGESFNDINQKVQIEDYFITENKLTDNKQRNRIYTERLADKITSAFKENNIVFTSHIVAFVAFEMIKKRHQELNIYEMIRLPKEETEIDYNTFEKEVKKMKELLLELKLNNKIKLSDEVYESTRFIINNGIKFLGTYHPEPILKKSKKDTILISDMKLLYFYHNRTSGYNLESKIG
jgi:glycerol-3-phosphate O-acyltransferase